MTAELTIETFVAKKPKIWYNVDVMNSKKLAIQQFIEKHSDWEKILAEKPYCLTISRDEVHGHKLIMFKYNQIDSDFNVDLVRECRGLILDEETFEVVCHPFEKFGNYGESYCPEIDWKSCYVTEKLDGSLIKVVKLRDGNLLVSTNGTIDAYKAPLAEQLGCTAKSFGGLFEQALAFEMKKQSEGKACFDMLVVPTEWLKSFLEPGFTYMFELTSPFNKVVVTWHETRLHFIGCRDNNSGQEMFFNDNKLSKIFNTPKVFPLRSIDECIEAANELDCNHEGYVVVDKHFNRVKVKSPTYVSLHHMKNNGVLSYERGLEIVRGNELEEVLTYFPEFAPHLEAIKEKHDKMLSDLMKLETSLNAWMANNGYDTQPWLVESSGQKRKELAMWAFKQSKSLTGFVFSYADHKTSSAKEWLEKYPTKNLCKLLGLKEDKES